MLGARIGTTSPLTESEAKRILVLGLRYFGLCRACVWNQPVSDAARAKNSPIRVIEAYAVA
jgi:hypothetical protein